jgi:tetratricopeptide (TPR) repeat protein
MITSLRIIRQSGIAMRCWIWLLICPVFTLWHCGNTNLQGVPAASAEQSIDNGWLEYKVEEFENAKMEFNSAVTVEPSIAEAYNGLGWANFRLRLPQQAIFQFTAGIDIDTTDAENYQNMLVGVAFAYFEVDNFSRAEQMLVRVINTAPDKFDMVAPEYQFQHDGLVTSVEVRLLQAMILYYNGRYEAAYNIIKDYLKPGIILNPDQSGFEGALLRELESL